MGSGHSQPTNNQSSSSSSSSSDSEDYQSLESDMEVLEDTGTFTMDAAIRHRTFNYPSNDDLILLEENLDEYEKISMVYLLYEDPNKACTILQRSLTSTVKDWCQQEARLIEKWNWKLLESLCIIKNYKVLRMMGHNKMDMILTFLPTSESVLYVNLVRKTLFCIFENLHQDQVDRLIIALQMDLTKKNINCFVNRDNLELTFLYLEKVGYMSLTNLKNVYILFKSVDMLSEYEQLKALHDKLNHLNKENRLVWSEPNVSHPSRNVGHVDFSKKQNISGLPDSQVNVSKRIPDTEDCYHIDPLKPGVFLIINNESFYTEFRKEFKHLVPEQIRQDKLEDRTGTNADKEHLEKVFKNLRYEVIIKNNLTHDIMNGTIKECVKMVHEKKFSSFFVAVLSHGDKEVIYGCNSIPIKISEIQETLYASSLSGKPRVLLIQACQGEKLQEIDEDYATDGPGSPKLISPKTADVLVFYATVPNYSAVRHLTKGTWFIQSLCEIITHNNNKDHFGEICLKVTQDVTNKRWGNKVMVPLVASTLTKKLYLISG